MTDETPWTQKFDRWWEEYHVTIPGWEHRVRGLAMAAFLAGAAAERAERESGFVAPWERLAEDDQ